ncbi:hypothetical protein [Luteitalea sp. TBR-22]|uniref:hypothetical protein n=1 Tax=Luteitalea sp. TBR-22 TaxID=2802971 RepID=UPI001EF583F4|nr:hypothetical protein [Luteitalea sp. TBR-22]
MPRQTAPLLVALLLGAGCAGRGSNARPAVVGPEVREQRLMEAAGRAEHEGRHAAALETYLQVAGSSARVDVSREAYLRAGLLRLGGDSGARDVVEAARLLRESRAGFQDAQEPLILTATLVLLDRLAKVEQDAAAAAALAARDAARRDDDARELRRTVAMLRHQLEKRDEALRKAAAAAVGPRTP